MNIAMIVCEMCEDENSYFVDGFEIFFNSKGKLLGKSLVNKNYITKEQLLESLKEQTYYSELPENTLLSLNYIDEDMLEYYLQIKQQMESFNYANVY